MSGIFLLDWAALAVSLFNVVLMLWLGLTVLLNADRRTWGVWLAAEGLLMGAAFFIAHSSILARDAQSFGPGVNFWWQAGWGPLVASPFAWYVMMLWYSGFWDDRRSALHRRQLPWFVLTVLLSLFLVGLLLLANPLPNIWQAAQLDLGGMPALGGIPLLFLGFPPYILMSIGLSLDALLRPAPPARWMGTRARQRARPWLVAATLALLAVSVVVGGLLFWLVFVRQRPIPWEEYLRLADAIIWVDFILAALIGLAILLLGQALVSYEVFTGKILPRRGFFRQWRNAVILAAGVSAALSASLTLQLRPIYSVLLALLLMTTFYALAGWRAHVEREESIHRLRPFVSSPRLYERFFDNAGEGLPQVDVSLPFTALCQDVLGVRRAVLLPAGALAALAGAPLRFPPAEESELPALGDLRERFAPGVIGLPLEGGGQGFVWAVPLWSERGLIGVLLLGEKVDGSLFSQEEIEIARAGGERLVDLQASAELARRLMSLQRQRLAQSQVLDRRARRVLHDDVLPRLHTALLGLSAQPPEMLSPGDREAIDLLTGAHRQISDLLREMPAAGAPELARLGLLDGLRQVLEGELRDAFERVAWRVGEGVEERCRELGALEAEVVFYAAREALRNAAQHARAADSSAPLHLCVSADWAGGLRLVIEDDGVGMAAGGGTRGSGQGLALHSTLMAVVGGSLALESAPGEYTRVVLSLPG